MNQLSRAQMARLEVRLLLRKRDPAFAALLAQIEADAEAEIQRLMSIEPSAASKTGPAGQR